MIKKKYFHDDYDLKAKVISETRAKLRTEEPFKSFHLKLVQDAQPTDEYHVIYYKNLINEQLGKTLKLDATITCNGDTTLEEIIEILIDLKAIAIRRRLCKQNDYATKDYTIERKHKNE